MPFHDIMNPQQLAILTAALDDFCRIGNIQKGTTEHDLASFFILSLYRQGATTDKALAAAVENAMRSPEISFGASGSGVQPSPQHDR